MVLTHLVLYSFLSGAGGVVEPQPTGQPETGGGSGKKYRRYNTDSLDPNKWRKKGKRLEARVEVLQKKIQVKREKLDLAPTQQGTETLRRQIAELYKTLLALLGELDMARKAMEEVEQAEVLAAYLAYRRLH